MSLAAPALQSDFRWATGDALWNLQACMMLNNLWWQTSRVQLVPSAQDWGRTECRAVGIDHSQVCRGGRMWDRWGGHRHGRVVTGYSGTTLPGGEKAVAPTPALLPGKSHGWRSLVGCSPWGLKESDTTERLNFHFSLSCTGEGNGNPLQYSCLENPRDRGAWWAAIYGVAQSRTRLKRFSSRSSIAKWGNCP